MPRLTINNINAALKAAGFDAEVVKGDGYFWFDSEESIMWYTSSVSVCRLHHLGDVEKWVDEYRQMKAAHDEKQ